MKRMLSLAAALLLATSLVGCKGTTGPGPDGGAVVDQFTIDNTAKLIKVGTSATIAIALVAIPKEDEAKSIALEAKQVLEGSVIPILKGDEAGLVNGLKKILSLEIFDSYPKLAKYVLLLQVAMPMLQSKIPADLLDKPLTKVPPDVKAYVTAFFEGADDGVNIYLGGRARGLKAPPQIDFQELRKKLAE
jgi:hypothetical protein